MKRNPLSGTGLVFRFSIRQMLCSKGWLISTIAIAALLLFGIPLLLLGISAAASDDTDEADDAVIRTVLVCDETDGTADYNILRETGGYADVTYTAYDSMEAAIAAVTDADSTVILRVTKPESAYLLTVYLPDDSALSRSQANSFGSYAESCFAAVLMQKASLTPEEVALLSMPVASQTAVISGSGDESSSSIIEEITEFLVPFMMMMLLYMMVLFYGQSMANSVMLEKTSKLIETILTAVHPVALMAGKLLATACSAVVQILLWLFALIGGSTAGTLIALSMIPDTDNEAVLAVNSIIESSEMFSVSGILLTILMLALGFLLYLSLAAVAGALASKSEDLNKTNVVFVLVLVISFFLCMGGTGAESDEFSMISGAAWLNFFPFTSILIVPAKLILGKFTAGMITGSLLCLTASVALFVTAAAAIYKLLVLYRGNPPTPAALLKMFRQSGSTKQKEKS